MTDASVRRSIFALIPCSTVFLSASWLMPPALSAQTSNPSPAAEPRPLPPAPDDVMTETKVLRYRRVHAFSAVALQLKAGSAGAGFDLATPLFQRVNLRGGAAFLPLNTGFDADGLHIEGAIQFQNASVMVDIFPFNNSFRISPGFAVYNDTHLDAAVYVPGGQAFSLGDGDYTSDPGNPIHGAAYIKLGGRVAPRFTLGWGNMIPRKGGHFSVPFEVGFQYSTQPTLRLLISGNSCGTGAAPDGTVAYGCGPVDQTQVAQEQSDLQANLNPYRFYPVLSLGLSYRFGH